LEKYVRSIRYAVKRPFGVAYPRAPVETGHVQRFVPSTATVIRWAVVSMLIDTSALAGTAIDQTINNRIKAPRRVSVTGRLRIAVSHLTNFVALILVPSSRE